MMTKPRLWSHGELLRSNSPRIPPMAAQTDRRNCRCIQHPGKLLVARLYTRYRLGNLQDNEQIGREAYSGLLARDNEGSKEPMHLPDLSTCLCRSVKRKELLLNK